MADQRNNDGHPGPGDRVGNGPGGSRARVKDSALRIGVDCRPLLTLPAICPRTPLTGAATFKSFSGRPTIHQRPAPGPLSMVELPRLIAQVGPGLAERDSIWVEGPHLMAAVLGTNIPVTTAKVPSAQGLHDNSPTDVADTRTTAAIREKKNKSSARLTGAEVAEILATENHPGALEVYCLKESSSVAYRPYHLEVVDRGQASSEYHIFSANGVLRVTAKGGGGLVPLAQWRRECLLWGALQNIPFFRFYKLHKAFARWRRNVRRVVFQRKCQKLRDTLLQAMPPFRHALIQISSLNEDLNQIQRLPWNPSKMYTLSEFKDVLIDNSKGCLRKFQNLLRFRHSILNAVHQESYRSHQELQLQVESSRMSCGRSQPLHLHMAHQRASGRKLAEAEYVLQKMGNMVALVNQMLVQGLVALTRREVTSFLNNLVKRDRAEQGALFWVQLVFGADGVLGVDPPLRLFQDVTHEALLTAADSTIQMCDDSGLFLELSSAVPSPAFPGVVTFPGKSQGVSNGVQWMAHGVRLPKYLLMQGHRPIGSCCPVSRTHLEWQLSAHDLSAELDREQATIMQEAQSEVQRLCDGYEWLADIHLVTSQWCAASLDALRGQPASAYGALLQKVHHWAERIRTVSPSFTTSNRLFSVCFSSVLDPLGLQLKVIEEDVLVLLEKEMELHSKSLVSDLKHANAELNKDPHEILEYTEYAAAVKRVEETSVGVQPCVEYVRSLRDTITANYREMSEKEVFLEEEVLSLRDRYVTLLRQAQEMVRQRLPSTSDSLYQVFLSLVADLEKTVSDGSSGTFLDPTQDSDAIHSELDALCERAHDIERKITELSGLRGKLRGFPLDLTVVTTGIENIDARKQLWELLSVCTATIGDWKALLFREFAVPDAQEKVSLWQQQAVSLQSTIPTHDEVLQETMKTLEDFGQHLPFLAQFCSPMLKEKHLHNLFRGVGLQFVPEMRFTVAELMSLQLGDQKNIINKVFKEANMEWDMEEAFGKLQLAWESRLCRLAVPECFNALRGRQGAPQPETDHKNAADSASSSLQMAEQRDSGVTLIISGLEALQAETEDSVMSLSIMLASPHIAALRSEVQYWIQLLQELGELLEVFQRYQQAWRFLTKMFYESVEAQQVELLQMFHPVDKTFREIMFSISSDPHVLNMVCPKSKINHFYGDHLSTLLTAGLSSMEAISNRMLILLDRPRAAFPRLCFLTDGEVMKLLSLIPSPSTLLPIVRKCFKGVCWLEVASEMPHDGTGLPISEAQAQGTVQGVFGSIGEQIRLLCAVNPYLDPLVWLCELEKQLLRTMTQLVKQSAGARQRPQLEDEYCEVDKYIRDIQSRNSEGAKYAHFMLDLLRKFPLQCLLVAEEAAWCEEVLKVSHVSAPDRWSCMKESNSSKLKNLCLVIRQGTVGVHDSTVISNHSMMLMCYLVQFTMNHGEMLSRLMGVQCELESSFEWQSLIKYHVNVDTTGQNDSGLQLDGSDMSTCYVDVLGSRLPYGYEYLGPKHWTMVNTPSTDRVALGILLALSSYRCGFVSGPCMSGKRKTVIQLGRALGRQVITLQCCQDMNPRVFNELLCGALQTGAYLVWDSVNLLTQVVQSLLGQILADINKSFSVLKRNTEQVLDRKPTERVTTRDDFNQLYPMVFAGKNIFAKPSYGSIIISSKCYKSEMPQSLRAATRPISLANPDYRIIAEVLLASQGFAEAMSLSRRLVTLFNLAKESCCLPEFISGEQTSWLVVLKKIVAASGKQLQKSLRQDVVSFDGKGMPHVSVRNRTGAVSESDRQDSSPKHNSQVAAMIEGVKEEKSVVQAISFVLFPDFKDSKKATQFCSIFKETFPLACAFPFAQQCLEEEEQNLLRDAITEELERRGFYSDTQIILNALTMYKALKFSRAVLLMGPSGSGKSSCYQALAGALRSLAAGLAEKLFDEGNTPDMDTNNTDPQIRSTWSPVKTVVLFPNAMSNEEVFGGFCEKEGQRDGYFNKVLRESEQCSLSPPAFSSNKREVDRTERVTWVVMDGEPLGQPGWLDSFGNLCNWEDPSLSLASGETFLPTQSMLKLLAEITDLCDATPSAVSRCSIVCFTGADLWKAIWKAEMDALSREGFLDQGTLTMWNRLAEDLFSKTLKFCAQNCSTSIKPSDEEKNPNCKNTTHGLQEVMSFIRILRVFTEDFGKVQGFKNGCTQKDTQGTSPHGAESTDASGNLAKQELQTRNTFLVAYIWGFGGHLHPRCWPQYDLLVRQLLFKSRYRVEVPREGTVFEHFFSQTEETLGEIIERINCPRSVYALLPCPIIPKYQKYAYLLDRMVEASQPVLLLGEAASGKTSLCKTLLTADRPHISLPASPLLSSHDMRSVLNKIPFQRTCTWETGALTKQILFVDDLHEAPCDAYGKVSMALETLRQSMSERGTLTSDSRHFNFFRPGAISYMATCHTPERGGHSGHVISSRLTRLFSIFVLPSLSIEVLFSIHAPGLKLWLKDLPCMPASLDISRCIITATQDLYHAVSDCFKPTAQRPHFLFSHHDLWKVFQGMRLYGAPLQKNTCPIAVVSNTVQTYFSPVIERPGSSVFKIAYLWFHECQRTFGDRLCTEDESNILVSLIAKVSEEYFVCALVDDNKPISSQDTSIVQNLAPHTETPGTFMLSSQTLGSSLLPLQLLQQIQERMDKMVYGCQFSEPEHSGQKPNFKLNPSYHEQDFDELVQQLSVSVTKEETEAEWFDGAHSITSSYTIHRQRVHQLLHILRALLIPGGHGVLFAPSGDTGRKTNVRFAAHLTGCQVVEVHPGNEGDLDDILEEAVKQVIVNNGNVVILAHQQISKTVRDKLLLVMSYGTCPGLYSNKELTNLIPRLKTVKKQKRHLHGQINDKFWTHLQQNVHVFLLLPFTTLNKPDIPADIGQDWKVHLAKALSLCCCVELHQPWSTQCLVEAATYHLNAHLHMLELDVKQVRGAQESSLSLAMARIHQSGSRYASVLLGIQPFGLQTYTEFIAHFFYLCNHLHRQGQGQASRIRTVLKRMQVLIDTAQQYKQDVERLQDQVGKTQQLKKELLRAADNQRILFDKSMQSCVAEENNLVHLESETYHTQQKIDIYFEEASPLFQSVLQTLRCLSMSDLNEVRHYRDPPEGVVKVMDAICLLFCRPLSWESAKQLLGQSNFFEEMQSFARHQVTDTQLRQLGLMVDSPCFQPGAVREVSRACESLCVWVRAVYHSVCAKRRMLPLEASRQLLKELSAEVCARLAAASKQKEEECWRLWEVERRLQVTQAELEELVERLCVAEKLEAQSAAAVAQMEIYLAEWQAAAQEAQLNIKTVPGDALVLAAIVCYSGVFSADVRTELLSKWRQLCLTGNLNLDPEDPRTLLFTDPAPPHPAPFTPIPLTRKLESAIARALGLDAWQVQSSPARLVVELLLWGKQSPPELHWPLLADAQHHREICSLSSLIAEQRYDMVLCADDPELLDKLDVAAEKGLKVLVSRMEAAVPSPGFLSRLGRSAGTPPPWISRPFRPTHPEFCLVLSTDLPVRLLLTGIHPSILLEVRVVDLSPTTAEVQELLLSQLLPSDHVETLVRQRSALWRNKQALKKKFFQEKTSLVDYILRSSTPLLQDPDFLPQVSACTQLSQELQVETSLLRTELEKHDILLAAAGEMARVASVLYQALQDVARLSPSYHFSLRGFIATMQRALDPKNRREEEKEPTMSEFTHRLVSSLLTQYLPCLLQSHAIVLKLLVSVALLPREELSSEPERAAFLSGLSDLDLSPDAAKTSNPSVPDWIPADIHAELLRLERIPAFRGLIASLGASQSLWQEYLHLPSSTVVGAVACHSHSHLTLLQRALLWKTLLPASLGGVAEDMAACCLSISGRTGGAKLPHAGNPEALSHFLDKHRGPVILTLPGPDSERWASIDPLRLLKDLQVETREVQVIVNSLDAWCDRDFILSALRKAATGGDWFVFTDCHLLDRWDDKVLFCINQLISDSRGQCTDKVDARSGGGAAAGGSVHPLFRLWFITRGFSPHSVPAAVRLHAMNVMCDPPRGVKEELRRSLYRVLSLPQSEGLQPGRLKPVLRCAVLHVVLLQRQAYEHSGGSSSSYRWTNDDLQALVDAHVHVASLCHNEAEALEYLVNLVHGGHVSDSIDLEVVQSVIKACRSSEPPLRGGGPHVLYDVINLLPTHLGLQQGLVRCMQGVAHIKDPRLLGFSADLAAEVVQVGSHSLNLQLRDSQSPRSSGVPKLNLPAQLAYVGQAKERLQALESVLAHREDAPPGGLPLADFLCSEWEGLRDLVPSLLHQLHQQVPDDRLMEELLRLERRVELLRAYLWDDATDGLPATFRLSAFRNARGFLAALRREAVQGKHIDIEDVALDFQVLSSYTLPNYCPPGSVYLCGLELRGALWDTGLGALQDTVSPNPCALPLVRVTTRVTSLERFRLRASRSKNPDHVQGPSTAPPSPLYHCPVYLDGEDRALDGRGRGLADANVVVRVPLVSKLSPVLCSLRRVRLVSTL